MASSFNSVTVVGNITREIDVRYTPKGTAVAEVGLAVNKRFKVGDETREKTVFLEIKCWGKTAELAGEYLKKGSSVLFSGELDQETWEDKQTGAKRSKIVIVAEQMVFLGSKRDGDSRQGERQEPREQQQSRLSRPTGPQKPPRDADLDIEDSEIPF